jgi:hypothetical protein
LVQWALVGLPLYSIQRETFHEFIDRIRDQEDAGQGLKLELEAVSGKGCTETMVTRD